ncbi:serine/threonine-protein kinase [Limnobacter parvus]|uniref:Serine/threonine-protein kinase n=1 Tax=Limnobacter parvus TaxID=2939690 RepID=A0ABT1XDK5_9BURK|nr:serine/threonine-protein kinase [Limnobacter parvus]MCR2745343.1 serine/threonine-protein kinase [Limnobacter parvus]
MAHLSVGLESSSGSPKSQHGSNPPSFLTPNRRTFDYFDATPKVIAKGGLGSVRIATPRPRALIGNDQTSPLADHQEFILKEGKFQPSVGAAQVRREITAMEKLAGVNSPKLLNQEITSSGYRLVMEQASGAQLNHFFDNVIQKAPVEEQAALLKATSKELLLGLQNLHNKDVCHRDIKPGNVFVSKNDDNNIQVTYIDFGDASSLHEADQGASGTDKYSLPSKEDKTAAEIDLYSMGRMLAEATGQIPELKVDFDRQVLEDLSNEEQAEVAKPVSDQAPTQEAFINTLCYKQGLTLSDAINHPWLQS